MRNRLEPEKGLFIAESPKVIHLALEAGYIPISFLMEKRQISGQGKKLIGRCSNIPVYTGERNIGQLNRLFPYPGNFMRHA